MGGSSAGADQAGGDAARCRRYKTGLEYVLAQQMTTLGIGLIVIGVALVCGGLILWPRAPQGEHENQADGTMADVSRRVDESSDAMDSPTPPPEIFTKGNDDTRTYQ